MDNDFVGHDRTGLDVDGDGADLDGVVCFVAFGVCDGEIFQFTVARKDGKLGATEFDVSLRDLWSGFFDAGLDDGAEEIEGACHNQYQQYDENCDDLE